MPPPVPRKPVPVIRKVQVPAYYAQLNDEHRTMCEAITIEQMLKDAADG